MAFCPECGKPAAAQATQCVHCGREVAPKEKSAAAPARFKGTMIMTSAPATGSANAESSVPATQGAAAAASETPKPVSPTPITGGAGKPGLKATMVGVGVGTGMSAEVAGAVRGAADGGGDMPKHAMAFAATQPQKAAFTLPQQEAAKRPAGEGASAAVLGTPAEPTVSATTGAQGKKYLPGDPMAPAAARPQHAAHHAGSPAHPDAGKSKTWLWVALGCLGMVVIGALGVGAASYLGLSRKEAPGRARVLATLQAIEEECRANQCRDAGDYFHEKVRAALLPHAKDISAAALAALGDPKRSRAASLAGSPDEAIAKELGLSPKDCLRLGSGTAKVVGCSAGSELQIVHMSGLAELK